MKPAFQIRHTKTRDELQRRGHSAARREARGFTILELMIVLVIIVILATLGAGRYEQSLVRARESALKQDLSEMRKAIDDYTLDKEAAPTSLDDLVSAKYLRDVPEDPLTRQRYWQTDTCDSLMSPDQTTTGICDVHSVSNAVSPFENTAYNTW